MNIRPYRVLKVLVLSILAACAPAVNRAPQIPVERGIIATPNVTITAEDNSFILVSGTEFRSPFQVNLQKIPVDGRDTFEEHLRELSSVYLKLGAKRVKVDVGGKQLYGVLSLNMMPAGAYGPASRMYRIEIPQEYIDAASSARVSVVYEKVDVRHSRRGTLTVSAWILWLSDAPIR